MRNTSLALLSFALMSTSALAAPPPIYITTFGGVNWGNDFGNTIDPMYGCCETFTIDGDFDAGWLLGGAVGVRLDEAVFKGFRSELEISWRHNNLDGSLWCEDDLWATTDTGESGTFAATLNAVYDFDIGTPYIIPNVMIGAGYGSRQVDASKGGWSVSAEANGFVWQVGAGVDFPINDTIRVGLNYRFFDGPDVHGNVFGIPLTSNGNDHAVTVNLTFDLS